MTGYLAAKSFGLSKHTLLILSHTSTVFNVKQKPLLTTYR